MEHVDTVVVGAGVVGLACARALAMAGREVLILEATERFGSGISSRNSEVVHAGLYYPPGSLKARLCLRGRELLYAYCGERQLGHRRCGKLLVAVKEAQLDRLQQIRTNAEACGVDDLRLLERAAMQGLEPELRGAAALISPSTGIVDSHALMLSLLGDAERHGATLATHAAVTALQPTPQGLNLTVDGDAPLELTARRVVNAAGLGANALAASAGLGPQHAPPLKYARGNYFALQGRVPFSHLIYPIPEQAGLGIHLTLDLAGQARFGPDVEWIEAPAYEVDPARGANFYRAIRLYWPGLPDGALQPGYAGVRPKLSGPGEADADFRVDGPAGHGIEGLVNLLGIESPGLTACLAIGEQVAGLLR